MTEPSPFKVALVWRGDQQARLDARPENSRLKAIFEALERQGLAAVPAVYSEAFADEVRAQLLAVDAVLVWVDPVSGEGQRRHALDRLLAEVAAAGVLVSGHPGVIARMGVKAVLHWTRDLGWGSDTAFYETPEAFAAGFPPKLAGAGPRVLKQNRSNGGLGVWKVAQGPGGLVEVLPARGERGAQILPLVAFMAERAGDFDEAGGLVDQPFQARLMDGMVRCYMTGDRVAGFGHQLVRALAPPEAGPAGPRLYSGPDDSRFQRLRASMERDWAPGLAQRLGIDPSDLPVIWDADFLLGSRTAAGEDTYVLCEINANSVFPIPEEAPELLARTLRNRLANTPRKAIP